MTPDDDQRITALAGTLVRAYGLEPAEVTQVHGGTSTDNYRVTTHDGGVPWFAKVYRDVAQLPRERAAVELAEYARHGAVPVPAVRRTVDGDLVEAGGRLRMSLWEYVPDVHTAEGALTNDRWFAVGEAVGRLHHRLADHPAARPVLRAPSSVCDLRANRARHERLIAEYGRKPALGGFEAWALEAARERQGLWGKLGRILDRLPELTFQVLHGDLASPNLLLRGAQVSAIIDFQPPNPRHAAWEIARIACDPRSLLLGWEAWRSGLSELLAAYQDARPDTRVEDLLSVPAVGCVSMLASTYPLAVPLEAPDELNAALETYGRARHEAALMLLDGLEETQEALRDRLR